MVGGVEDCLDAAAPRVSGVGKKKGNGMAFSNATAWYHMRWYEHFLQFEYHKQRVVHSTTERRDVILIGLECSPLSRAGSRQRTNYKSVLHLQTVHVQVRDRSASVHPPL